MVFDFAFICVSNVYKDRLLWVIGDIFKTHKQNKIALISKNIANILNYKKSVYVNDGTVMGYGINDISCYYRYNENDIYLLKEEIRACITNFETRVEEVEVLYKDSEEDNGEVFFYIKARIKAEDFYINLISIIDSNGITVTTNSD